ncbi:phosphatases II [Phlegmacium glaucopus]|nr:phosphatases II [Phlegmacium glaucopus]
MLKKTNWFSTSSTPEKHMNAMLHLLASRENLRLTAREVSSLRAGNLASISHTRAANLLKQGVKSELVEHYSIVVGGDRQNIASNRYLDVVPYDRTRVIVQWPPADGKAEKEGDRNGRYLNANWVLERRGKKWWIATQAPLRHTAHAFLSLILQPNVYPPPTLLSSHSDDSLCVQTPTSRVRTVVQLTQNIENGRTKADSYFPSEVGSSFLIPPEAGCDAPPLKVTLLAAKSIECAHCIQSTVSIAPMFPLPPGHDLEDVARGNDHKDATDDGQVIFQHLLYLSWPDHGVPNPEDRASLLAFIQLVESTNRDISLCTIHPGAFPDTELDLDPPIMVGCSAGIGRTGSFLALSSLLRASGLLPPALRPTPSSVLPASPLGPLPKHAIDDMVVQEIDSLREQRPGMVQRPEQVALVYEVLADTEAPKS